MQAAQNSRRFSVHFWGALVIVISGAAAPLGAVPLGAKEIMVLFDGDAPESVYPYLPEKPEGLMHFEAGLGTFSLPDRFPIWRILPPPETDMRGMVTAPATLDDEPSLGAPAAFLNLPYRPRGILAAEAFGQGYQPPTTVQLASTGLLALALYGLLVRASRKARRSERRSKSEGFG